MGYLNEKHGLIRESEFAHRFVMKDESIEQQEVIYHYPFELTSSYIRAQPSTAHEGHDNSSQSIRSYLLQNSGIIPKRSQSSLSSRNARWTSKAFGTRTRRRFQIPLSRLLPCRLSLKKFATRKGRSHAESTLNGRSEHGIGASNIGKRDGCVGATDGGSTTQWNGALPASGPSAKARAA